MEGQGGLRGVRLGGPEAPRNPSVERESAAPAGSADPLGTGEPGGEARESTSGPAAAEAESPPRFEDLSEQVRRMEAELREQREWFERSPDAYLVTSPGGTIREANEAASVLLSTQARFIVGRPLTIFFHLDSRSSLRSFMARQVDAQPPQEWVGSLRSRGGPARQVLVRATAVRDPSGRVTKLHWLLRDLGESDAAAAHLKDASARIEQRVQDRIEWLERSGLLKDSLLTEEREARVESESARQRLDYLAEAGTLLSASLDYEETLQTAARLAVPYLADWSMVDFVLDEEAGYGNSMAHIDPASEAALLEGREVCLSGMRAALRIPQVIQTGEPFLVRDAEAYLKEALATHPECLALVRRHLLGEPPTDLAVLPMEARGRVLGCLTLCRSGRRFRAAEDDLVLAQELARRAAIAIDNARLFRRLEEALRRQQAISEVLQVCFLPDLPRAYQGIEVGHLYAPVPGQSLVGGDFYDVFALGDRRYGLMIGDVAGKGVEAAALAAGSRFMLRALAAETESPAEALAKLDRLLEASSDLERFVTLFFGVLDARAGSLVYGNAGHEPAILELPEGEQGLLEATGPILGALAGSSFEERRVSLWPGSSLLLYTDGLSDARVSDGFLGAEGVADLFSRTLGLPPDDRLRNLLQAVKVSAGGSLRDDAAILLVRWSSEPT